MGLPVYDDGAVVTNVASPSLEVFASRRVSGVAVLVAGGGEYARSILSREAHPAAGWLAGHGITAFVLRGADVQAEPNATSGRSGP